MDEDNSTLVTRRELLKIMTGAGISLAAALTLAEPLQPFMGQLLATSDDSTGPGAFPNRPHWGMVIDLSRCIGCWYCVYACQATNDVADDMRWNILVVDQTPTDRTFFVTRPCLHCQNAPCVSVCPVTATYLREDGLVMMDYNKCIGCRYCEAACPYGARSFNWRDRSNEPNTRSPEWGTPEVDRRPRGVVEKCTFCVQRLDKAQELGLIPGVDREVTPACVNVCPVDVRHFGDLNDPESEVSRIIATQPTLRLREDMGTEPSVYYIPPEGLAI